MTGRASAEDVERTAQAFVAKVTPSHRPLIALDHDGTLSPIAATPDAAVLAEGAREALHELSDRTDVVIISGRALADLRTRFAGLEVTLVSEHGLRAQSSDGALHQLADPFPPGALSAVRAELESLLAPRAGWLLEDKQVSLAVHHRLVSADALEPTRGDVERMLERAITAGGLDGVIQHGHAVLELRPRGAEKGIALRELVRTRDARPVLMIGDDLTDEPALTLAESIGGIGVLVGSRERVSRASARLDDPSAVVALLERLATLLGSPR